MSHMHHSRSAPAVDLILHRWRGPREDLPKGESSPSYQICNRQMQMQMVQTLFPQNRSKVFKHWLPGLQIRDSRGGWAVDRLATWLSRNQWAPSA